jgi:endonuclease-3 related protein
MANKTLRILFILLLQGDVVKIPFQRKWRKLGNPLEIKLEVFSYPQRDEAYLWKDHHGLRVDRVCRHAGNAAVRGGVDSMGLLANKPPMWWPAYGTFEVVVGAVLTQNSQWTRVEQSLDNLCVSNMLTPEALSEVGLGELMELIRPSGLFKNKSKVLQQLSVHLLQDFEDFDAFKFDVSREWLLAQKGIGPETADSILCYACERDAMVVDAYTARLLEAFGYTFETYDDLQSWCSEGFVNQYDQEELPKIYALFHGMIVEYVKRFKRGRTVSIDVLAE